MTVTTKAGHPGPARLPLWRLVAVSAVALTTANCAQNPQKLAASSGGSSLDPKYGVKASPRLYNEGDVIPKGGGRRFSGKPYVVAGRTYVPREDAKGYVREGLASWYGAAFHGRLTANGEVFDRLSIAAAHPTLPLPSYARVTNLANGHSMIVRVNDRGPYHANRLMDVSEEVAEALEFRRSGTARVRVEYAGKASTAGSDDRKLLATLRTDGQPAAIRGQGPVMVADLGPDAPQVPSERLARARGTALAFRQADEPESGAIAAPATEVAAEAVPAPRPARPAPVLVASATVAVPPALQPTASRADAFRPVRPAPSETHPAENHPVRGHASVGQAAPRAVPLSLAPPPLRLAGAGPVRSGTGADRFAAVASFGKATAASGKVGKVGSDKAGRTGLASEKATPPIRAVAAKAEMPGAGRLAAAKPVPTRLAGQAPAAPAPKAAPTRLAAASPGSPAASGKVPSPGQASSSGQASSASKASPASKALASNKAGPADAKSGAAKPSLAARPAGRARFAEAR